MEAIKPDLDTANKVWDQFVEDHPHFGYVKGKWSFVNFIRLHVNEVEPGVMYKTLSGRWLADRNKFDAAVIKVLARPVHPKATD